MSLRTTRAGKAALFSSQPVPSLPTELKRSILSFCDPPTLARAARASLSFAELATPFLYRDVVLTGPEALEAFFCKRDGPSNLDELLRLDKTLSLTFFPNDLVRRRVYLSKDRFPTDSNLLSLDLLKLHPIISAKWPTPGDFTDHKLWVAFLSLLDPLTIQVLGTRTPSSARRLTRYPDLSIEDKAITWPRLQRLEWTNSGATSFLGMSNFLYDRVPEPLPNSITIVYNFHQQWAQRPTGGHLDLTGLLMFDLSFEENEISQLRDADPIFLHPSVQVVVKVRKEEEGVEIRERVELGWDLLRVPDSQKAEWRARLRFEVVDDANEA